MKRRDRPFRICYSIQPNSYIDERADEIAKIYDGFFFNIGAWDDGSAICLGVEGSPPQDRSWWTRARRSLSALNASGVTENLLTVCFSDNGDWPCPDSLLSEPYAEKMQDRFLSIGRAARDLGFRGICVDIEYPFPRYSVDHPVYTYAGYTVEDLLNSARGQGRTSAAAMLEDFPEAVIFTLPGTFRCRPIELAYLLGMLEEMATRSAPGGFHLGMEFTYCLHDPITNLAASRSDDLFLECRLRGKTQEYWQRCCTVAPGVWPLHMVETGGKGYPLRPWKEEIRELGQQVSLLGAVAKRYIWVFTSAPSWYLYTPSLEKRYGLRRQAFGREDVELASWHSILAGGTPRLARRLVAYARKVKAYDGGRLTGEELCDAFGTPARWWVLGILGNLHTKIQYSAQEAALPPIDLVVPYHGRDGLVRWFAYDNMDPRGITSCIQIFDYRNTDDASAHLVSYVHSKRAQEGYLNLGWDDGLIVGFNGSTVFEETDYPPQGHGWLYRDRYSFEKRVAISIPKGRSYLSVTSLNSHGNWLFSLRLTDGEGIPLKGLRFRLQ